MATQPELLEWFESKALIHDWEYADMPKSDAGFTLVNLRFAANVAAAACELEPGTLPVLLRIGRALLLALLCQWFGRAGYRDAGKGDISWLNCRSSCRWPGRAVFGGLTRMLAGKEHGVSCRRSITMTQHRSRSDRRQTAG